MNPKNFLAGLAIVALVGWVSLAIVIIRLDPFSSTAIALPLFFGALFLTLSTTLALVGFYVRVWTRHGEIYSAHLSIALRQAVLASLAITLAVGFQMLRILTWWDSLLIVAAVGLIEIYFSSQD